MRRLAALAACVLAVQGLSFLGSRAQSPEVSRTQRRASVVESLKNPVKTVSETIDDFYKAPPFHHIIYIAYKYKMHIIYMYRFRSVRGGPPYGWSPSITQGTYHEDV